MVVKLLANGDTVFATLRQPEKLQSLQKKIPRDINSGIFGIDESATDRNCREKGI